MICPLCKSECERDEVDVGVGNVYGPWRCGNCGFDGAVTGSTLIAAERERQIFSEGYTPPHDDGHSAGELVSAAVCYAKDASSPKIACTVPPLWPFGRADWKPSESRMRNLVKAGALIAAEIDRLLRSKS